MTTETPYFGLVTSPHILRALENRHWHGMAGITQLVNPTLHHEKYLIKWSHSASRSLAGGPQQGLRFCACVRYLGAKVTLGYQYNNCMEQDTFGPSAVQ